MLARGLRRQGSGEKIYVEYFILAFTSDDERKLAKGGDGGGSAEADAEDAMEEEEGESDG